MAPHHARVLFDRDRNALAKLAFLNLGGIVLALWSLAAGAVADRYLYAKNQ